VTPRVALLRGVNVGGHRRVPMAELRALAEGLGWSGVRSYIQSGNLVFAAAGEREALEDALEAAIAERFGFPVPVLVRSAAEWAEYADGSPFAGEAEAEPNRVMLALSKAPPADDAAARIEARAAASERVARRGDALWIHFPAGAATSRLTPALLERAAGSPVTLRNWRTVAELGTMLRALQRQGA
jgi:uncharacterized protein (DUF1697 family)